MSNWIGRLKLKMKELNLTQEELAKKLGVTRSAIAHYVQGTRHPPLKQFVKLAHVLHTEPGWLQFGKSSTESTQISPKHNKQKLNRIPILEWDQILSFNPNTLSSKQQYLNYCDLNQTNCYAVQIKGDSMVSSSENSFNPGDYVIIDPHKEPAHGQFVLVCPEKKKEAILRQYIEEGGSTYLKPLNIHYPITEFKQQTKICGVVIANITLY